MNPITARPQGDGDPRPFGTNGKGPRLVHVEKSGPDFIPVPVAEQFGQSLQQQALKTAGEVLNSLHRGCLLDLCASWPRLLRVAGVTSRGARRMPRETWAYAEMRDEVELALCYAQHPEAIQWQQADASIRGYAMDAAQAIESRLDTLGVNEDSVRLAEWASTYRKFAEGKS